MPNDVKTEPAVSWLTTKAPMKMAGPMQYPHRSTAAMAKPVAGQMGDALGSKRGLNEDDIGHGRP